MTENMWIDPSFDLSAGIPPLIYQQIFSSKDFRRVYIYDKFIFLYTQK